MIAPDASFGGVFPAVGLVPLNPYKTPLLNRLILISSGVTVSVCHYAISTFFFKKNFFFFRSITVFFGVLFLILQGMEYYTAPFTFADSCFGSIFFLATGFHGLHVAVGTVILFIGFLKFYAGHFSVQNNISLELSIWYWHFVDVV